MPQLALCQPVLIAVLVDVCPGSQAAQTDPEESQRGLKKEAAPSIPCMFSPEHPAWPWKVCQVILTTTSCLPLSILHRTFIFRTCASFLFFSLEWHHLTPAGESLVPGRCACGAITKSWVGVIVATKSFYELSSHCTHVPEVLIFLHILDSILEKKSLEHVSLLSPPGAHFHLPALWGLLCWPMADQLAGRGLDTHLPDMCWVLLLGFGVP